MIDWLKVSKNVTIGGLATCLVLSVIVTGCSEKDAMASDTSRFMLVEAGGPEWDIYADRETGVMYAVSDGLYNRGTFTLLVDANGDPLIYEGDEE